MFNNVKHKEWWKAALVRAVVSNVPEHSVILVSEEGNYMFREKYEHGGK